MKNVAAILANHHLGTVFAKTTHGLIRGPSRFRIAGVVDPELSGQDAGQIFDGRHRGIPIFPTLPRLLEEVEERPDYCVVGIATPGGVLPDEVRSSLIQAAETGLTLVNGLHQLLSDDEEIAAVVERNRGEIIDLRRPKATRELRFWTGEVRSLKTPRVAVLGTDCAVGKRTTASLLREACREAGISAELVYTGQTGWLQGYSHGFILDATPNDFVCGELEGAILTCARETDAELILLEGQSALRNPSGPCGSELILAADVSGVILQHAPKRELFTDLEDLRCTVPPLGEEIELIRLLGAEVWAVTLHHGGMDEEESRRVQEEWTLELGLPVLLPLRGDLPRLLEIVRDRLHGEKRT